MNGESPQHENTHDTYSNHEERSVFLERSRSILKRIAETAEDEEADQKVATE